MDRRKATWTVNLKAEVDAISPTSVGALPRAEVRVAFQPIVDIATGRLFAHEALVRCSRPEYASPPNEPLPPHTTARFFSKPLGKV